MPPDSPACTSRILRAVAKYRLTRYTTRAWSRLVWPFGAALLALLPLHSERSGNAGVFDSWSPGAVVKVPPPLANVLLTSDQVTLYRITGEFSDDNEKYRHRPKTAGYPTIAETPIASIQINEIAAILSAGSNYLRAARTRSGRVYRSPFTSSASSAARMSSMSSSMNVEISKC